EKADCQQPPWGGLRALGRERGLECGRERRRLRRRSRHSGGDLGERLTRQALQPRISLIVTETLQLFGAGPVGDLADRVDPGAANVGIDVLADVLEERFGGPRVAD